MIAVQEIIKTCDSCPAQWEGKTTDGKMIYVRYRWGLLTIEVSLKPSDDIFDALDGAEVFNQQIGAGLDGHLTYQELKSSTIGTVEFPMSETT